MRDVDKFGVSEDDIMDTAVVLAGGLGTRLRPLTETIPKPLLPIAGRPIVQWTLDLLHTYAFKKVVLAIGYKAEQIERHFGQRYKGMRLVYSVEKEALGTGGPLRLAQEHLGDTFLVINGDNVLEIDLNAMHKFHAKAGVLGTIALTEVEDPSPFGVVVLEGDKIKTFVEKPSRENAPSRLINAGVYVLEPEILSYLPDGRCSLEREVFQKIAPEGKLAGFRFTGQWFPTDTIEKYAIANALWKG